MQYIKIKNKIIGFDTPKVCVPIVGRTEGEIEEQLDKIIGVAQSCDADSHIDIVEFRGDYFEGLGDKTRLTELMRHLSEKLIDIILMFTIRSEAEGGEHLMFDVKGINDINEYVIKNRLADIVDLELFSGAERIEGLCDLAKENNVKIIISNHDFKTTPHTDEIVNRLRMMQDLGADIAKIAVMPENKIQLMGLLNATVIMNEQYADIPIVTMSMGKLGAISRVTGQLFGSAITFAALENASAPGQIPLRDLNKALGIVDKYCSE